MIIDFKEIPEPHKTGGLQDTWELFCREFFDYKQYEILDSPTRGADGGLDLKVRLKQKLSPEEEEITWLVSCKHMAHSGDSVSPKVEANIRDRIESNGCNGFIGFYSTLPSSGLMRILNGLSNKMPYEIFDKERIEREILGLNLQEYLLIRFFPVSFKFFKDTFFYREPVKIFLSYVKNEYPRYESALNFMFKSVENIIPYLRRKISIHQALKEQNIRILEIKDIENHEDWSYKFLHSGIIKDYSFKSMINELIPNEIKHLYNIDIYPKYRAYFLAKELGLCVIYHNYFVCSPQFIELTSKAFDQLADDLIQ